MTKKRSTKRALLLCALSLLMCVSMFVGSTYAWFTDEVVSASNVIESGNLDIEVEYTLDGENWNDFEGAADLFQKGLWEPGHTEVVVLRIKNVGSLALKYVANMNIVKETVGTNKNDEPIVLSDILTVSTLVQQANDAMGIGDITLALAFNGENSVGYENTTTFKAANVLRENQELHPGDSHYMVIKVDMAETVDNKANHKGPGYEPSIEFGLNVLAAQYTYENDSFGNQYDKNAAYPWDGTIGTLPTEENGVITISTAAELAAFANDVNVNKNTYSGKTVVLAKDIDLNNVAWTPIGQTGATEFKGTFDGQGHTIKNLNVDSSAQTGGNYSSGLFGWVEGKVTIKNVNIDGATVKGNHNVAALLGYTYSAKISNCHVSNATIVCNHANNDACGDKAGTIVGYAGNESRFTNCSASDSTVIAGRDAGQLIGTGYNVSVSGCSATDVTVSANGSCYKEGNINNAIIGRVMG